MATKSKSQSPKSSVNKKNKVKKSTDKKLFIAFGALLVIIVAIVGIYYVNFGEAANVGTYNERVHAVKKQ